MAPNLVEISSGVTNNWVCWLIFKNWNTYTTLYFFVFVDVIIFNLVCKKVIKKLVNNSIVIFEGSFAMCLLSGLYENCLRLTEEINESHLHLLFFLLFQINWYFYNRVIQWSHPACNTVMLCGCCICFGAAIALGVDGRWVQPEHFAGVCAARAWLLATGFSMAYGAMFTKVWRVHRHTTKPKVESKVTLLR